MKDKTIIKAFILALGQIGSKIISLIFIYNFSRDLGRDGMSLYAFSYVPFSIFADLSSFGLIPGTSKLVSRLIGDQDYAKVNYLLRKGILISIVIGVCFFLFMLFFNKQILSISLFDGINEATFSEVRVNLLLASISLFVIPINNFMRGFLQGQFKMYPSCISLILEQVVKVIIYLIMKRLFDYDLIKSVFIIYIFGYLSSFIVLMSFSLGNFKGKREKFNCISVLLKSSIPFGIATMFFTIYQFIDSMTLPVLLPKEGYYTAYMYETIRLIFFPIVIAQALGGALNPKINLLYKENKIEDAKNVAIRCSNLIITILVPLTIAMMLFSNKIYNIFYQQENGGRILYQMSGLIMFFGVYKVLIGISLGLPKGHFIIIATIISAVAKYILNLFLIRRFEYIGAIYATIIAVSICILVAYYVLFKEGINIFFNNIRSLIGAFVSGIISVFLVSIFMVCFSLNRYPVVVGLFLYSNLLFGIYYIFLKIIKQIRVRVIL